MYWGSLPTSAGPGLTAIAVRNRPVQVVVSDATAKTLEPFELFMDEAGQVWVQDVLRKKWLLVRPFQIREVARPS